MAMSGVNAAGTSGGATTGVISTVESNGAQDNSQVQASAAQDSGPAAVPQLSQTQRVESKQGSGTTMAGGTGEGHAYAVTGPNSTGAATAISNGNGVTRATVPEGADGNAAALSEAGGDAEAVAGKNGHAAAVANAEGNAEARASEHGNTLAVASSLGNAKAVSEGTGRHAIAVSEDVGNSYALARRGGTAVALARGVGDVEAVIAGGDGSAGNVTVVGLGSGFARGLQNALGFLAVINRSGVDVEVENNFIGVVRFEMTEDGLIGLTINGDTRAYQPNPGATQFKVLSSGNLTGAVQLNVNKDSAS